jgi:hypothetical protein
MKSPIFIFSLPRAGSTLLQRILMSHREICSISEPWILLPQVYATKNHGTLSEYSSLTSQIGIKDFIENLPNKKESYINAQRNFIYSLYAMQCKNNEKYFLDKTPRYYLIIDEIVELFPDAKFIFLFRNPVQVFASIVNTWGKGRFRNIITTYDDLIKGTKQLSEAYLKYKHISYSVQYEDLILNSNDKLNEISNYLEIPLQNDLVSNFSSQNTIGTLGDPTGVKKYNSISQEGLVSWKNVFNSFYRKRIIHSLLGKIDSLDLKTQGYNKEEIFLEIQKLNNHKNKLLFRDFFDYSLNCLIRKFKLNLFINKKLRWIMKEQLS